MAQEYLLPTASSVAVFLNGVHVDLAFSLNYRESVPKSPVYGYNDFDFSSIVRGKEIVQGVLVCLFVYPGYLSMVLGNRNTAYDRKLYNYDVLKRTPSLERQYQDDLSRRLETELPPNSDLDSKIARANFISSLISKKDPIKKAQTKQALVKFFTPGYVEPQNPLAQNVLQNPLKTKINYPGNEIDLYYTDPEFAAHFVRFTNVEFTETSQQFSQAGAEGSAEPLYMIHQFIAKSADTIQLT